MKCHIVAAIAVALALAGVSPARAQIDYRNLDDERPVLSEDAYPIERYAFELLFPWRFESQPAGVRTHVVAPEVAYGLFDNFQFGLKVPFAAQDNGVSTDYGLAGLRPFALYNFNTESGGLPAFALRADVALPVGSLAGDHARVGFKAIATRSFGMTRVHVNVARGFGSEVGIAPVDAPSRWFGSLALDRTFFRQSLLAIGEIAVLQSVSGARAEIDASAGIRYQWRPTFVWDVGVTRRLRSDLGPNYALTVGLSHAFALRGLMPSSPR